MSCLVVLGSLSMNYFWVQSSVKCSCQSHKNSGWTSWAACSPKLIFGWYLSAQWQSWLGRTQQSNQRRPLFEQSTGWSSRGKGQLLRQDGRGMGAGISLGFQASQMEEVGDTTWPICSFSWDIFSWWSVPFLRIFHLYSGLWLDAFIFMGR